MSYNNKGKQLAVSCKYSCFSSLMFPWPLSLRWGMQCTLDKTHFYQPLTHSFKMFIFFFFIPLCFFSSQTPKLFFFQHGSAQIFEQLMYSLSSLQSSVSLPPSLWPFPYKTVLHRSVQQDWITCHVCLQYSIMESVTALVFGRVIIRLKQIRSRVKHILCEVHMSLCFVCKRG